MAARSAVPCPTPGGISQRAYTGHPAYAMSDFRGDPNSGFFGACTWYAWYRRQNEPLMRLGMAYLWAYRAPAFGLRAGSYWVVGATAVFQPGVQGASGGHAAHVEAVYGGGWFLVSEMSFYWNGGGWAASATATRIPALAQRLSTELGQRAFAFKHGGKACCPCRPGIEHLCYTACMRTGDEPALGGHYAQCSTCTINRAFGALPGASCPGVKQSRSSWRLQVCWPSGDGRQLVLEDTGHVARLPDGRKREAPGFRQRQCH